MCDFICLAFQRCYHSVSTGQVWKASDFTIGISNCRCLDDLIIILLVYRVIFQS